MSPTRPENLRDARLQKALDTAPDAGTMPSEWVRRAVREAAQWPAPSPSTRPRASGWWGAGGLRGRPWNAALATLLVAGFVGLLWQGQEVPDATPERMGSAQGTSPPRPPSADAPGRPETAAASSAAAATRRPVERDRNAGALRAREDHGAHAMPRAEPPAAPPVAKAAAANDGPATVAPAPAAMPAPVAAEPQIAAVPPAPAMAAAPMPRPMPAPLGRSSARPMAPGDAATAAAELAAPRGALPGVPADWTEAVITGEGHPALRLPRAHTGALQARLEVVLAAWQRGAPPAGGPSAPPLQVELLGSGGEVLASFHASGPALSWRAVSDARTWTGQTDAAALEALRAELARLSGS